MLTSLVLGAMILWCTVSLLGDVKSVMPTKLLVTLLILALVSMALQLCIAIENI